jgi:hypothetical protein
LSLVVIHIVMLLIRPPLAKKIITPVQAIASVVGILVVFFVINIAIQNDKLQRLMEWIVLAALFAIVTALVLSRKPRHKGEQTWTSALLGATLLMAAFFLAFASIPNEWVLFANNTLGWTGDKILLRPSQHFPFTLTYIVLNDGIATGFYIGYATVFCLVASKWQKRPDEIEYLAKLKEDSEANGDETGAPSAAYTGKLRLSRFGRPLKSRA